jgi:hypothetical protein
MTDLILTLGGILSVYATGWFAGRSSMHKATACDVSVVQKLREMTKWLETTKKFGGDLVIPSCTATYFSGDDRFQITMVREGDA